jgi:hypothetical protein
LAGATMAVWDDLRSAHHGVLAIRWWRLLCCFRSQLLIVLTSDESVQAKSDCVSVYSLLSTSAGSIYKELKCATCALERGIKLTLLARGCNISILIGVCSGVPPLVNDVQVGYPLETVGPY